MSFDGGEAQKFFEPLTGRTATFLVDGRQASLDFARIISGLVAIGGRAATILDLDALYSSHADRIFSGAAQTNLESTTIRVPEPGSDIEGEFSNLFEAHNDVLIIDSLNTFFHLLSLDNWRARSRKLAFALEALSQLARTNGKIVIFSMYRREGSSRAGTRRPISYLSDLTSSVTFSGDVAIFRVVKGSGWSGGEISIRNP
jgi:hypothetical protein